MCDWEAEEFAEYLLWVEAEKARARARARSMNHEPSVKPLDLVSVPTAPIEA